MDGEINGWRNGWREGWREEGWREGWMGVIYVKKIVKLGIFIYKFL